MNQSFLEFETGPATQQRQKENAIEFQGAVNICDPHALQVFMRPSASLPIVFVVSIAKQIL